jgi:hypothetical protein
MKSTMAMATELVLDALMMAVRRRRPKNSGDDSFGLGQPV